MIVQFVRLLSVTIPKSKLLPFRQLSFMIQYCYTSLVLVTKGLVLFLLKLIEIRNIKSVYSVTLNYILYVLAHAEILKCKLTI